LDFILIYKIEIKNILCENRNSILFELDNKEYIFELIKKKKKKKNELIKKKKKRNNLE